MFLRRGIPLIIIYVQSIPRCTHLDTGSSVKNVMCAGADARPFYLHSCVYALCRPYVLYNEMCCDLQPFCYIFVYQYVPVRNGSCSFCACSLFDSCRIRFASIWSKSLDYLYVQIHL